MSAASASTGSYRGRLAPTPTGHLHLGHARTFELAHDRARQAGGTLIYREEDLDPQRCQKTYAKAAIEDLRWLGLNWQEGPDIGGPHAPYRQSQRLGLYKQAMRRLLSARVIYPCRVSRSALNKLQLLDTTPLAPDEQDAEPLFPIELRPTETPPPEALDQPEAWQVNWRFRIQLGEHVGFDDALQGHVSGEAGKAFGDFLVWRKDGVPSYELAVVVDDALMQITEVVRGADLLRSTLRQLCLYRALRLKEPAWAHAPLVRNAEGQRLAKRHHSLSLRQLRQQGHSPEAVREMARAAST
jgi:glutamyl-tRNA synthetase